MTTGQLIKIARKNAGITQSELAQRLNIPFQSVSQWERDLRNPKYETICRIAAALDVEFADLVPQEVGGKMIVDHVLGTSPLPPPGARPAARTENRRFNRG